MIQPIRHTYGSQVRRIGHGTGLLRRTSPRRCSTFRRGIAALCRSERESKYIKFGLVCVLETVEFQKANRKLNNLRLDASF